GGREDDIGPVGQGAVGVERCDAGEHLAAGRGALDDAAALGAGVERLPGSGGVVRGEADLDGVRGGPRGSGPGEDGPALVLAGLAADGGDLAYKKTYPGGGDDLARMLDD